MTTHRIDHSVPSKYARERFQLKETIVTISAEERHIPVAKRTIATCRRDLENFIRRDPFFMVTLDRYQCPDGAPPIVQRMTSDEFAECLMLEKGVAVIPGMYSKTPEQDFCGVLMLHRGMNEV